MKEKKDHPNKGRKLSEEHKAKISNTMKGMKKPPMSQEHKDNISQAMKGKNSGKSHYKWCPFVLVVNLPNGDVKEYEFKGNSPIAQCSKRFNLGRGDILYKLRQGEVWEIKVRTKRTKHKFKVGSTITLRNL